MDNEFLTQYINIFKRYKKEFTKEHLDISMSDLGISSFTVIEIMIVLEEEFGIEFPDYLINSDLFYSPQTLFDGLITIVKDFND